MWKVCLKLYQGVFTYKNEESMIISAGAGAFLLFECKEKKDEGIIVSSINSCKRKQYIISMRSSSGQDEEKVKLARRREGTVILGKRHVQ